MVADHKVLARPIEDCGGSIHIDGSRAAVATDLGPAFDVEGAVVDVHQAARTRRRADIEAIGGHRPAIKNQRALSAAIAHVQSRSAGGRSRKLGEPSHGAGGAMRDIDASGIDGAAAVGEPAIAAVPPDLQGTRVDRPAGHHRDPGGLARVRVVVDTDIELIGHRDRTSRHIEVSVASFMTKADPIATIDRAAAQVDRAHGRIRAGVAMPDADEIGRGNRRAAADGQRAVTGKVGVKAVLLFDPADVELIGPGVRERGGIRQTQQARAKPPDKHASAGHIESGGPGHRDRSIAITAIGSEDGPPTRGVEGAAVHVDDPDAVVADPGFDRVEHTARIDVDGAGRVDLIAAHAEFVTHIGHDRVVRDGECALAGAIPADNQSVAVERRTRAIHRHMAYTVIILAQSEPSGIGVDRAPGGDVHRTIAAAVSGAEEVVPAAGEGIQMGIRPGDIQHAGGDTATAADSATGNSDEIANVDRAGIQSEDARPTVPPDPHGRAHGHRRVTGNRRRPRGLARVPVVINADV